MVHAALAGGTVDVVAVPAPGGVTMLLVSGMHSRNSSRAAPVDSGGSEVLSRSRRFLRYTVPFPPLTSYNLRATSFNTTAFCFHLPVALSCTFTESHFCKGGKAFTPFLSNLSFCLCLYVFLFFICFMLDDFLGMHGRLVCSFLPYMTSPGEYPSDSGVPL